MKHLSKSTFTGNRDDGVFIMPAIKHTTYCNKQVFAENIGNLESCTCDECMDAECWERIDREAEANATKQSLS